MPRIAPNPLPRPCHVAAQANLRVVMARLAAWNGLVDLNCAAHASCDGEVMLVIDAAAADGPATWVVTTSPGGRLRLEALVDEVYLDLLAEGTVDRIMTHIGAMAARPRVAA